MKVGTDGVLLGAWADVNEAENILDIGTGSGVIALILAQRSKACIEAIDLDENACRQAKINFEHSPFRERLSIKKIDFLALSAPLKYDLLVSNPPYFSRSLRPDDIGRRFARHDDSLPLRDLIEKSASLLKPNGKLALILPFDSAETANSFAAENALSLCRRTNVATSPKYPPKRVMLEYSPKQSEVQENNLCITSEDHSFSKTYIALTKDFYLALEE
jgi:tRNA1Val (adenine37-N6)-methyltransferase